MRADARAHPRAEPRPAPRAAAAVDATLAALADPVRRAVVDRLRVGPARSSELAAALRLPRSTVSKHLAVLRKAGLIDERVLAEDARGRRLALRPQPFAALRGWLAEVEAMWTDELAAFKRHAERGRARR